MYVLSVWATLFIHSVYTYWNHLCADYWCFFRCVHALERGIPKILWVIYKAYSLYLNNMLDLVYARYYTSLIYFARSPWVFFRRKHY
jgi:hypothetical protein